MKIRVKNTNYGLLQINQDGRTVAFKKGAEKDVTVTDEVKTLIDAGVLKVLAPELPAKPEVKADETPAKPDVPPADKPAKAKKKGPIKMEEVPAKPEVKAEETPAKPEDNDGSDVTKADPLSIL